MALGTHYEKASSLSNFFSLRFNDLFILIQKFLITISRIKYFLIICFIKTGCHINQFFIIAHTPHFRNSQKVCITPKFNIGTTSSHIGSNRHGTFLTCLSNNFCFFFMVLSIQHRMAYTFFFKHFA